MIMWKHFSTKRPHPHCVDQEVEEYHYSKAYHKQYGRKFRTNKAIRLVNLEAVDAIAQEWESECPKTLAELKRLLNRTNEGFASVMGSLQRIELPALVKLAQANALLDLMGDRLLTIGSQRLLYPNLIFLSFIELARKKSAREDLLGFAGELFLELPELCITEKHTGDELDRHCLMALLEAYRPLLRQVAKTPGWTRRFVDLPVFSDRLRKHETMLFDLVVMQKIGKQREIGKARVAQMAEAVASLWLMGGDEGDVAGQRACQMLVTDKQLQTPFQSAEFFTQRKKPLWSVANLLRAARARWTHSPLAQAVMSANGFARELLDFGIEPEMADELLYRRSLSKVVNEIQGASHPAEVEHIRQAFDRGLGMRGFYSLSCLQTLFTNPVKRKLDRHGYLKFLAELNTVSAPLNLRALPFDLDPAVYLSIAPLLTKDDMLDWLRLDPRSHGDVITLRDCLQMTSEVLRVENEVEQERQRGLLSKWLEKNGKGDPARYHRYLVEKLRRDGVNYEPWKVQVTHPLFHAERLHQGLNDKVIVHEDVRYRFWIPKSGEDLQRLGRAQRHCVGSSAYRQRGITGDSAFLVVMPERTFVTDKGSARPPTDKEFMRQLGDGYTLQLARDGVVVQAKGRKNSDCPVALIDAVRALTSAY